MHRNRAFGKTQERNDIQRYDRPLYANYHSTHPRESLSPPAETQGVKRKRSASDSVRQQAARSHPPCLTTNHDVENATKPSAIPQAKPFTPLAPSESVTQSVDGTSHWSDNPSTTAEDMSKPPKSSAQATTSSCRSGPLVQSHSEIFEPAKISFTFDRMSYPSRKGPVLQPVTTTGDLKPSIGSNDSSSGLFSTDGATVKDFCSSRAGSCPPANPIDEAPNPPNSGTYNQSSLHSPIMATGPLSITPPTTLFSSTIAGISASQPTLFASSPYLSNAATNSEATISGGETLSHADPERRALIQPQDFSFSKR